MLFSFPAGLPLAFLSYRLGRKSDLLLVSISELLLLLMLLLGARRSHTLFSTGSLLLHTTTLKGPWLTESTLLARRHHHG